MQELSVAAELLSEADKPITWGQRFVLEGRELTVEERDRLVFDCPPEVKRWWETRKR